MEQPTKEHVKVYGPIYTVLAVLLGGGGTAALTDNIPVTQGEFRVWTDEHVSKPHDEANDAIDLLNKRLASIEVSSIRAELKQAYADKCLASGAALTYINREIRRLQREYKEITGERYEPQPCIDNTES